MGGYAKIISDHTGKLISRIGQHPFLHRCREGSITEAELKRFLVQQGIYSSHFTRYLCALLGNLEENRHVEMLAENLCEELGLTVESDIPHSRLYRDMLAEFDLSLEEQKPSLGTRRLIDTMFDHCRDRRVARGLGALCLGAEALVPHIYADLIKGFMSIGIPNQRVQFFHIHVDCDDAHADTMRDIMEDIVSDNDDALALMLSSGTALVEARWGFFDSIVFPDDSGIRGTFDFSLERVL